MFMFSSVVKITCFQLDCLFIVSNHMLAPAMNHHCFQRNSPTHNKSTKMDIRKWTKWIQMAKENKHFRKETHTQIITNPCTNQTYILFKMDQKKLHVFFGSKKPWVPLSPPSRVACGGAWLDSCVLAPPSRPRRSRWNQMKSGCLWMPTISPIPI